MKVAAKLGMMAAVGLAVLAGDIAAARPAGSAPRVTIAQGRIEGLREHDLLLFRGIPYAAPPVGALRFRAPRPPASWRGVRKAERLGPACLQTGAMGVDYDASEDCLTLNIWTPSIAAGTKRPVIVYIHGGAFLGGASGVPMYDGSELARRGAVVVNFNYRLGRLGFFAHPALAVRGEPAANYGLMDQLAALRWVRANIGRFGGDAGNVTVMGESAGAISINLLLTMPAAAGLFDKAIVASGFAGYRPQPLALARQEATHFAVTKGVAGTGAGAADALRRLPASAFTSVPETPRAPVVSVLDPLVPQPVLDGQLVTVNPVDAFAAGAAARVPLLLGGTDFEASALAPRMPLAAAETLAALDRAVVDAILARRSGDLDAAANDAVTLRLETEPSRFVARCHAASGAPVFLYRFAYVPAMRRAEIQGAAHGSDIGFLFDTLPAARLTYGRADPGPIAPADAAMADRMGNFLVAFAASGDPGGSDGVRWPRFRHGEEQFLLFGNDGLSVGSDAGDARLDALAGLAEREGRRRDCSG